MKYLNGFASQEFLKLYFNKISNVYKKIIFQSNNGENFPCYIIKNEKDYSLITLPNFSGPDNISFQEIENKINLHYNYIDKGYILSNTEVKKSISNVNFTIKIRYKNLYFINLQNFKFHKCRKDFVRSYKKFNKEFTVYYTLSKSKANINNFYKNYNQLSEQKKFSKLYKLSKHEIVSLLKNKLWKLLTIYIKKEKGIVKKYAGSTILSIKGNQIHQVYVGYDKNIKNVSKLVTLESVRFFQKFFKFYYLGGGINEYDTLSKFKLGLGSDIQKCSEIFFCKVNSKYYKDFLNFDLKSKWP